jgi:hypothetical protein
VGLSSGVMRKIQHPFVRASLARPSGSKFTPFIGVL